MRDMLLRVDDWSLYALRSFDGLTVRGVEIKGEKTIYLMGMQFRVGADTKANGGIAVSDEIGTFITPLPSEACGHQVIQHVHEAWEEGLNVCDVRELIAEAELHVETSAANSAGLD